MFADITPAAHPRGSGGGRSPALRFLFLDLLSWRSKVTSSSCHRSGRQRKSRPNSLLSVEGCLFVTMETARREVPPADFRGWFPPCKARFLDLFPDDQRSPWKWPQRSPAPHPFHREGSFICLPFVAREGKSRLLRTVARGSLDFVLAHELRKGSSALFPLCYFLFKVPRFWGSAEGGRPALLTSPANQRPPHSVDVAKEDVPPY